MDKEKKFTLMERLIQENIETELNKERVYSLGMMEAILMEILLRELSRDTVNTNGATAESIRGLELKTKCMGKGLSNGKMVESILEDIIWTRKMDTACLCGVTEKLMKESGRMDSSMEEES